jgi:hypothetical protein
MKRLPHPLALALVMLVVIASGTATAVARTTGARLTNDEYVLIGDSMAGAKKAFSSSKPDWSKARAACLVLGQSTPLLRASRDECLDQLSESQAWIGTSKQAQQCTQTTTTGIAAAAGSGSELNELVCLNPAYQALNRAVAKLATADRALRSSGIERGFTGRCLITLVPTPQQLTTETSYLNATKRLVADLALYIKVRKGKAPHGAISDKTVVSAAVAVTPARDHWLSAQIAYSLSVCPHA